MDKLSFAWNKLTQSGPSYLPGNELGQVKSLRSRWIFTLWKEKLEFQSCALEAEILESWLGREEGSRKSSHLLRDTFSSFVT